MFLAPQQLVHLLQLGNLCNHRPPASRSKTVQCSDCPRKTTCYKRKNFISNKVSLEGVHAVCFVFNKWNFIVRYISNNFILSNRKHWANVNFLFLNIHYPCARNNSPSKEVEQTCFSVGLSMMGKRNFINNPPCHKRLKDTIACISCRGFN